MVGLVGWRVFEIWLGVFFQFFQMGSRVVERNERRVYNVLNILDLQLLYILNSYSERFVLFSCF